MKRTTAWFVSVALSAGLWALPAAAQDEEDAEPDLPPGAMFRYENEDGVRVVGHNIPPEYVSQGYEILSRSGQVIETVPPELTDEEAAAKAERERREAERAERDRELRRRYASVEGVRAAKERSLEELQDSIDMLTNNLEGVRSLIKEQESRAARIERADREVPESLLETIEGLHEEKQVLKGNIEERQQEYQETAERYDEDMERYQQMVEEGRR